MEPSRASPVKKREALRITSGLLLALLQHARAETTHSHCADLIPKYLRRALDFEFFLCGIHSFTGGRAHGGDHPGATSKDACSQTGHDVYARRAKRVSIQAGLNSRAHIRGKSTSRIRHGIGGHCVSEPLCRSRTGIFQAFARQRGLQSGFNAGSCILCISGEVIAAHAFAYTRRDVLAGGLDAFGGRFNLQRRVQRGFQIGS